MKTYEITISSLFTGLVDYWGGDSKRWEDNAGCLFCHYTPATTYQDAVDIFVDDYSMGGDCDSFPEEITSKIIKDALEQQIGNANTIIEPAKYLDTEDYDEDDYELPVWIILIEIEKLTE